MSTFEAFLSGFFAVFTQAQFKGGDFLHYLQRPAPRRSGDEASVVDNTIVSPLLSLLGYAPGEQVYNQNNKNGRPDFAPYMPDYGPCFVVEDKSTGLELTLDANDPESHLAQLSGYLRGLGLRAGWLTNGRRLMVWQFDDPAKPVCALELDIAAALSEWAYNGAASLAPDTLRGLKLLWDRFRRETFADWKQIERDLAMDLEAWERQAYPLGGHEANQEMPVGAVRTLLQDLQTEARGILDGRLQAYAEYEDRRDRLQEEDAERARDILERQRVRVMELLTPLAPLVGLETDEIQTLADDMRELERDPFAFLNTGALLTKVLETLNVARARKFGGDKKAGRAWSKWDNGLQGLGDALTLFGNTVFAWHQRKAILRHDNRKSIETYENYALWTSVVQETMLGGMQEAQRRDEFALQATYIVFIRLLLIRVCEDKGILPNRFLSDGGLSGWQKYIDPRFDFVEGNPYNTLLDLAYQNAQNIYAHFFTGRELFNWYTLDRLRFIRVLHQLSRFNFADVDSDLIGTIYNTYVERPEKKQKGQYYTPLAVNHPMYATYTCLVPLMIPLQTVYQNSIVSR